MHKQLPALDFKKEQKFIKKAINESDKHVTFLAKVANIHNFEDTINKRKPKILHISCHGVCKPQEKMHYRPMGLQVSQITG